MNLNNRFIVRLTESQQRFEVLWKKLKGGKPSLKELAEMDALINRDPMIHQFVLSEMENAAITPRDGEQKASPAARPVKKIREKLRSFFKLWHIVISHGPTVMVT